MISTLRNSSPRATSAWMSGVGVTTIPPRNTRFPDSTTCTAVLASHHVVMLHLRMLLLRNTPKQRLSPLCIRHQQRECLGGPGRPGFPFNLDGVAGFEPETALVPPVHSPP